MKHKLLVVSILFMASTSALAQQFTSPQRSYQQSRRALVFLCGRLDTPAHRRVRRLRDNDQRPRALAPSDGAGRVGRIVPERRDARIDVADRLGEISTIRLAQGRFHVHEHVVQPAQFQTDGGF